ncbi:MAG: hypothetical protein WD269_04170 [Acidimicrobiia bacterium]
MSNSSRPSPAASYAERAPIEETLINAVIRGDRRSMYGLGGRGALDTEPRAPLQPISE